VTDPLCVLLVNVTVKADALGGRSSTVGLIARPGTLVVTSVSDRAWLAARQHDTPQALRADPDVLLVIDATDVESATPHRRMLGSTSRLELATAHGAIELIYKSSDDLLYRAGQRALGFSRLVPRQGEDRIFGFAFGDGPVRPHVGLLALRGALRLFELPAPGVTERSRALVRSAADLVSAVAQSSVADQPTGSGSPRQAYQERLVAAFRNGRDEPRAPEDAGGGAGVVTAVLLDERTPPDLRLELTVDGRPVALRCAASSRAQVRHLVACAIGDAARDAGA
jgi:hypothetical protein